MGIFKEAPIKSVTRDRDAAKANVDRLAGKLTVAEQAVIVSKQAAQRAALDGDDGRLDAAEAAERAALHRHSTLSAAHVEAGKLLAHLESQIAEMNDTKLRKQTAAEAEALADELTEAGAAYDLSTKLLSEVSERCLAVTLEARGLAIFTASSRVEVANAIPIVAGFVRGHARAVLDHQMPAVMPLPPAPIVVPAVVAPPVLKQVFCIKQVRWTALEGKRFAPKFTILELPPDVADRALALKACTPIPGDAWAKYKGTYVPYSHHQESIDLDADAVEGETLPDDKAPQPKASGHSPNPGFIETIGEPRLVRIGGTS
jgi:hypothetical protein